MFGNNYGADPFSDRYGTSSNFDRYGTSRDLYGRNNDYSSDYGSRSSRSFVDSTRQNKYNISYLSPRNYTLRIMLHINENMIKSYANNQSFINTNKFDPLPFHPNLTTPNNDYPTGIIMFVPLNKFTQKDVREVMGGSSIERMRQLFTTPVKYKKMLSNNNKTLITENDIKTDSPALKEVVKANIDLIKDIFLPTDSKGILYIFGREYVVTECNYNYDDDVSHDKIVEGKIFPYVYEVAMHITVTLASESNQNNIFSGIF